MSVQLDSVCRALAHPLRRQLLESLGTGECDVGILQQKTGADQPVVSKHLAVLREAGLVEVRTDGRRRCYTLRDPETTVLVLTLLRQLSQQEEPAAARV